MPTFRIYHKAVTESTNVDALSGVHGDVFTADLQTAGRGRLDHKWLSPPGYNLMMSAVLDVADMAPEHLATLPLSVGLAVHGAVVRFLAPDRAKDVLLKWPNDVLVAGRKISGILCERHANHVIVGIGVNVLQTIFSPEIANRATSLTCEGSTAKVSDLRDAILEELGNIYETWRENGFAALHARYAAIDFLKGRTIAVRQTDDDPAPVCGMCDGVQPNGTLRVADIDIFAGEAHVMLTP